MKICQKKKIHRIKTITMSIEIEKIEQFQT